MLATNLSTGDAARSLVTFERKIKQFASASRGVDSDRVVARELRILKERCVRRMLIACSQHSEAIEYMAMAVFDNLRCKGSNASWSRALTGHAFWCEGQSDMAYREYVYFLEGLDVLDEVSDGVVKKIEADNQRFLLACQAESMTRNKLRLLVEQGM